MSPTRVTQDHNPLRDPRDKRLPRIAGPCGLVLFGVTGDLARKKLMPAIYDLANRGLLPPGFSLVGFARRDWEHEDFAEVVRESVSRYARTPFREEVWRQLAEGMRFVPGVFGDDDAFATLRETNNRLLAVFTAKDPQVKKVNDSFMAFKANHDKWAGVSEAVYHAQIRGGATG